MKPPASISAVPQTLRVTNKGDEVPSRLRRLERRIVDRMAERALAQAGRTTPERTAGPWHHRFLGVLLALPVHLVTVVFGLGGVLLAFLGPTWPLQVLGGIGVLVAVGTRPSLPRRPEHDFRLTRANAPHLFALVDEIAAVVGGPVPHEVLITGDVNAFALRHGLRGRSLGLGAPLWVACSPQARVALLGHELGHFAHGDLTDGLLVGGAQQTLLHWYDVATGFRIGSYETNVLQTIGLAPLRALTSSYLVVLTLVNAAPHRRRELLADLDAVRAAGTDGALDLLDMLVSSVSIETAMRRAVLRSDRPDMWETIREHMATVTPEVRVRRRAAAAAEDSRVDDSHPADHLRIRLVETWPRMTPAVDVARHDWAAIDAELAPALAPAARSATDLVRSGR